MIFRDNLVGHIASGYSLIYLKTWEELRARVLLKEISEELKKKLYIWTVTQGLYKVEGEDLTKIASTQNPEELAKYLFDEFSEEMSIVVLCDFHPFLQDPVMVRIIRELSPRFKAKANNLIFISPIYKVPEDVKKDICLLEQELPKKEELGKIMEELASQNEVKVEKNEREKILESLRGLTSIEAEDSISLSIYTKGKLIPEELSKTKAQMIKKSGVLEYFESQDKLKDVGGFGELKKWLGIRKNAFTKEAKEYGISSPKGALLIGIPGCGKSLIAKSISSEWGFPLCKLDLGKVYGSLVGQSEENIREALNLAEAVAPSILWIDEIEKGLAGSGSSGKHDSGVTSRVFGTILNWMQEKKESVFVVATANNIQSLPPEFLRKGRFDEIFFADLPNENERQEIFSIHLRKRNRKPEKFNLDSLMSSSQGFTGAEIEEAINSALFHSFSEGRELKTFDIEQALSTSVPLSKTMKSELEEIRSWAKERAVNVSSETSTKSFEKKILRKIRKNTTEI